MTHGYRSPVAPNVQGEALEGLEKDSQSLIAKAVPLGAPASFIPVHDT